MKNTLKLLVVSFFAGSAFAQDFIAGWDFTGQAGTADVGTYSADVAGSSLVSIDTSAFIQATDFGGAAIANEANQVGFGSGGNAPELGDFDYNNGFSSAPYDLYFQGTIDGLAWTIDLDVSSFTAVTLMFDSYTTNSEHSSAAVSYTLDGGTSTAWGTETFASAYAASSLASDLDVSSASSMVISVEFSSSEADQFTLAGTGVYFDNIAISGTAVPEPSAYAAIAGLLVLSVALFRRRK